MNTLEILQTIPLHEPQVLQEFIIHAFEPTPPRRDHILAVAARAKRVYESLHERSRLLCCSKEVHCAALLHDIGYLPEISQMLEHSSFYMPTGWHPIDGANYLRLRGEERLAELIEGHSHALEVAIARGIPAFSQSEDLVANIITYCDIHTGPTGELLTYDQRLAEILHRKGSTSLEYRAHVEAKSRIENIICEIHSLCEGRPIS